jgi:hypothetical protein
LLIHKEVPPSVEIDAVESQIPASFEAICLSYHFPNFETTSWNTWAVFNTQLAKRVVLNFLLVEFYENLNAVTQFIRNFPSKLFLPVTGISV